jgi:hypothetical protein
MVAEQHNAGETSETLCEYGLDCRIVADAFAEFICLSLLLYATRQLAYQGRTFDEFMLLDTKRATQIHKN